MRLNVTELYELQLRKTPIVVCAYAPNRSVEYPASSWRQWVGKRYHQEALALLRTSTLMWARMEKPGGGLLGGMV